MNLLRRLFTADVRAMRLRAALPPFGLSLLRVSVLRTAAAIAGGLQ